MSSISLADYNKYLQESNAFIETRTSNLSPRVERFSANNLLDNFMGSNTAATKKLLKKIENYINVNLPNIPDIDRSEYISFLQRLGICNTILTLVCQLS